MTEQRQHHEIELVAHHHNESRNGDHDNDRSGDDVVYELWPSPKDPLAVARRFVDQNFMVDRLPTLRHWRGGLYEWQHTHWRGIEDRKISSRYYATLEHAYYIKGLLPAPWQPNKYSISDAMEALRALLYLDGTIDAPAWLANGEARDAAKLVSCSNGILDLDSRGLLKHTPRLWNLISVAHPFDPHAHAPVRWLEFLDRLWPNDPDAIRALQQWFGYVLSGATDQQKILLLVGPRRGGKGTIARVLTALVGKGHIAGPTLNSLTEDFGLAPLIGKSLAVISDARLGGRDTSIVVERLLSISGEDSLTINIKYAQQWTGRLPTRLMILSNELPRFGDASGAIASRFIMLTLTESWLGKEDRNLERALVAECSGILNWALAGLDYLQEDGRLFEPESSRSAVQTLADLTSPISHFVRERCLVQPDAKCDVDEVFKAWKLWCEDQGYRAGTKPIFGKNIKAAFPKVRRAAVHRDGEERSHVYYGLGLK